jgi:hypothetical protein
VILRTFGDRVLNPPNQGGPKMDWMKRRGSTAYSQREVLAETAKPHGHVMAGKYLLLSQKVKTC